MRVIKTAALAAMLLPLVACNAGEDDTPGIQPSGSGGERTFAASGFSAVELAGPDDVEVQVGGNYGVSASGDADVLGRLKIERRGDTLYIGRRRGIDLGGGDVKVRVTLPAIRVASIAGSGDIAIDRVGGGAFKGSISGSGNLTIGDLRATATEFSIAGSGNIAASGETQRLGVRIAGSGDIDAARLRAGAADISIAGSGGVKAAVDGQANVNLMGSGDVDLGPDARCTTKSMGAGTVRCGR